MGKLQDPLYHHSVVDPISLTTKNPDVYAKEHRVGYSGDESMPSMAVRMNRALRDKRMARPGVGRWVEYILPDMRRVYAEANLHKATLGRMPDEVITARVYVKSGGSEYTNDLHALVLMGMVEITGDLLDVVRTADLVGLYVPDPETRGQKPPLKDIAPKREKIAMKLTTSAREALPKKDFAIPAKAPESGSYPIENKSHARNALARVSQHGTPAEKAKVRAKVHAKYPDIGKSASLAKAADHISSEDVGRSLYWMLRDMTESAHGSSNSAVPQKADNSGNDKNKPVLVETYKDGKPVIHQWNAKKTGNSKLTVSYQGKLKLAS